MTEKLIECMTCKFKQSCEHFEAGARYMAHCNTYEPKERLCGNCEHCTPSGKWCEKNYHMTDVDASPCLDWADVALIGKGGVK